MHSADDYTTYAGSLPIAMFSSLFSSTFIKSFGNRTDLWPSRVSLKRSVMEKIELCKAPCIRVE